MSNDKPITVHSVPETNEPAVVEKQSFLKKGVNFVKTHKKTTIAVVALGSLVGVAAFTGKKVNDSTDDQPYEVFDDEVTIELDLDPTVLSES